MKKLLILLTPFLSLSVFLSFSVATASAQVAPTCSISFSPQVIKTGEPVTLTIQTSSPLTRFDIRYLEATDGTKLPLDNWINWSGPSTNAIDFSVTTETFGVGKRSMEGRMTGVDGSIICNGSYTLIANNDWDWKKTIILKNQITFPPNSTKVRACPTNTCYERKYVFKSDGSLSLVLTKKNGDWYYVSWGGVGQGWVSSNQIPSDAIQKLENQNSPATKIVPRNDNASEVVGKSVISPQSSTDEVTATSTSNNEVLYTIIGIIVVVLAYPFYMATTKLVPRVSLPKIPAVNWYKWQKFIPGLLGVGAAGLFVYGGMQLWDTYEAQQEKVASEQTQEKNLLQKQVGQQEIDAKLQSQKLAELGEQLITLKNRPQEVRVETKTVVVENKDSMADIAKEWSPRVVYVECTWAYTNTGEVYARASGSATLINYTGIGIQAVTNKHVLTDAEGYSPRDCKVILPGVQSYSITNNYSTNIATYKNTDTGYITLTPDSILSNITARGVKVCSSVNNGDKLLVLGYPAIGTQGDITVTEGIVSGIESDYYVTSAKIDHGNSGGAAILIKDDCYLGIPTWVEHQQGGFESLGRILKASFVVGN